MTTAEIFLPRKAMRFRPGRDRISYVAMWWACALLWRVLLPAMVLAVCITPNVAFISPF